ncbi:28S ribosomal protein S14, mitochondrial-like [Nilaparvata lugens]|uniref:28S ribosomal protein S14, mitochondrial-like n=1 Tax=Nilaparvata lugens TaxID=108931 RepID=UPI00193D494F|nr:28S ribosomal protein S14, mitochondrial-like [Nilaparvata lugens]
MALLSCKNVFSSFISKLNRTSITETQKRLTPQYQQTCNEWVDARMRKDVRKRKALTEYWPVKSRLIALKKNGVLPPELKEAALEEMTQLPGDINRWHNAIYRCAVTSRPRGTVYKWRLSRIVFRHLADYNKLAGIMRARW